MRRTIGAAATFGLAVIFAGLLGCDSGMQHHGQMWQGVSRAVAVLHGTKGNEKVSGVVTFTRQADGKVRVVADLDGLGANEQHAIHVHQYGDCSALDATSAGGHYNPQGHPHGLPPDPKRHAGDLGNLTSDANGHAHLELTVDNLSIAGMTNPVIGRGVIVHAKPDDGGQPTGNAGARIACGVIGIAKSE